jgi:hypothetical protein
MACTSIVPGSDANRTDRQAEEASSKAAIYFHVKRTSEGSVMLRTSVTRTLAAAAVGLFAVHVGTAQEVKNLPAGATAHFIYFPTGG